MLTKVVNITPSLRCNLAGDYGRRKAEIKLGLNLLALLHHVGSLVLADHIGCIAISIIRKH